MPKKKVIKYYSLTIYVFIILFSCKSKKQEMEIRYTSLNDYDANYIFDLENNINGLKKIHQFALQEITAQKHFIDSLKNSSYIDSLPKTYKEHQYGTSLSLTASDIYLYTPPNELSFDQVDHEDLVMLYELNEKSFTIKNISIYERYRDDSMPISIIANANHCMLKLDEKKFGLETLYQVLKKIKELNLHNQNDDFTYTVYNKENQILDISYTNKGTSLLLNYK